MLADGVICPTGCGAPQHEHGIQMLSRRYALPAKGVVGRCILVALARLTRIIWPIESQSRKPEALDRAKRGEYLRKLLLVETNEWQALLKTRHSIEHFDERLDSWRVAIELQTFADRNIMTSPDLAGRDPRDVARNFDPAARTTFSHAVNVDDAREASKRLVVNVWAVVSPHSHLRNVFPPPA